MSITAVIIAKNEATMIANCIETAKWCDEVLVVDSGSTDDSAEIAKRAGAKVIKLTFENFAQLRTQALKQVKTDWIFYLDADERVLPSLATEIQQHLNDESVAALKMSRQNIHYGKWLQAGGWQHDWVTRIFRVNKLQGWQGEIHESPLYEGITVDLKQSLAHLTHRSVVESLHKSADWTPMEAQLLFDGKTARVTARTLIRKPVMEIWRRLIMQGGWRDGMAGWVEALTQGMNRFLVYAQLWELQQQPTNQEKYQKFDQKIINAWKELTRNQRQ